ncbi:TonB family protein [Endozoicomonadaceae bacterium StTr2]
MTRLLLSFPPAVALSLSLFYGLAVTTSTGQPLISDQQARPDLSFLMVRQETDIELRNRQLPPEPEDTTEPEPEIPIVPFKQAPSMDVAQLDVRIPDIDMAVKVNLSPSLSHLSMPQPAMTVEANPTILSKIRPEYPHKAQRRGLEGRVLIEFIVNTKGRIKPGSLVVLESTPPGIFEHAALRALKRWRFKTRVEEGQAQPYKTRQELEFKLDR